MHCSTAQVVGQGDNECGPREASGPRGRGRRVVARAGREADVHVSPATASHPVGHRRQALVLPVGPADAQRAVVQGRQADRREERPLRHRVRRRRVHARHSVEHVRRHRHLQVSRRECARCRRDRLLYHHTGQVLLSSPLLSSPLLFSPLLSSFSICSLSTQHIVYREQTVRQAAGSLASRESAQRGVATCRVARTQASPAAVHLQAADAHRQPARRNSVTARRFHRLSCGRGHLAQERRGTRIQENNALNACCVLFI